MSIGDGEAMHMTESKKRCLKLREPVGAPLLPRSFKCRGGHVGEGGIVRNHDLRKARELGFGLGIANDETGACGITRTPSSTRGGGRILREPRSSIAASRLRRSAFSRSNRSRRCSRS